MEVVKICPFCGESSTLYVKDEQTYKYEAGTSAQEAFDDIDSFGRELIISGVCLTVRRKSLTDHSNVMKLHGVESCLSASAVVLLFTLNIIRVRRILMYGCALLVIVHMMKLEKNFKRICNNYGGSESFLQLGGV